MVNSGLPRAQAVDCRGLTCSRCLSRATAGPEPMLKKHTLPSAAHRLLRDGKLASAARVFVIHMRFLPAEEPGGAREAE